MKQQVNPVVAIVGIVVVLIILIFVGMKAINPAPAAAPKDPGMPPKPAEINGHPVPNNVPYDLMNKPARGQGMPGNGVAPNQMPGGGMQHP